jgi:hypothetical protein
MIINAKKSKFVDLINGLYKVQNLPGKKLSLVVVKNIKTIKEALIELEQRSLPGEEFKTLASKMQELLNSEEDKAKEIAELEKENKNLIDSRKRQIAEVQKELQEELELKLTPIKESMLPDDINAEQLLELEDLITK